MRVDALQQVGHARAQRGLRRPLNGLALVLGQQRAQRRVDLVLLNPLPARADPSVARISDMLDAETMRTRCALRMSVACLYLDSPLKQLTPKHHTDQQQTPRITATYRCRSYQNIR